MSSVLPENVQERIRAEEIYREEIRADLARKRAEMAGPPPFRQRLWTFWNSQVGGWLLSTVLVGSVATSYALYTDYCREARERRTQRREIALEVAFRIQMYEQARERKAAAWERRSALDGAYKPKFMYPKFEDRHIVSLLWELACLCDKSDTKKIIGGHMCAFSDTFAIGAKFDEEHLEDEVVSLKEAIEGFLPAPET